MSRVSCTRRLCFSAGHRVLGHEGHCANLHGHNYVVHLEAVPLPAGYTYRGGEIPPPVSELDDVGRVVDFAVLKQRVGAWIDEHWDHGFLFAVTDRAVNEALAAFQSAGGPVKAFALPCNPTAEGLARYLLVEVCPQVLHDTGCAVVSVVVEETENCRAEARVQ